MAWFSTIPNAMPSTCRSEPPRNGDLSDEQHVVRVTIAGERDRRQKRVSVPVARWLIDGREEVQACASMDWIRPVYGSAMPARGDAFVAES